MKIEVTRRYVKKSEVYSREKNRKDGNSKCSIKK